MAVQRGAVLGDRYELIVLIGAGAMGDVWRAIDRVLGRDVAVKVLRPPVSEQPGFMDRFRREARHAAMLSHPGVATVFDYGEQDGSGYLVMELVDGENLAQIVARDGALRSARVIDIITQIAAALDAAHRAGLVHRDIKPANVMITSAGVVKITDFGISRLSDSVALTTAGDVLGTPQYMAPEQVAGTPATAASDVYAVGVVAHELLTGQPPFQADNQISMAIAQLRELPPPLPQTVPRPLAHLIGRALAKDAARRPADGQSLLELLRHLPDQTVSSSSAPELAPTLALAPEVLVPVAQRGDRALVGPLHRHRTKRIALLTATAAAIVVFAMIALALRHSPAADSAAAGTGVAATTSGDPAAATVLPTTPPTTTPAAGPAAVATVVIDPATYIGRDHREVADELRALGLVVDEQGVDAQPGTKKNTVVAIEPTGPLEPGATVAMFVAKPGKGSNGD